MPSSGAESVSPNVEDDGSIPLAPHTGIGAGRSGIITSGVIGDGPHGSEGTGTGDLDFYAADLLAGEVLRVDVRALDSALDPLVLVYNEMGDLVAYNDDFDGLNSHVELAAPSDGTYYVAVSAYGVQPSNPNDSGSGSGAASEGPYELSIIASEV